MLLVNFYVNRYRILKTFKNLGFKTRRAFYNVCVSLDPKINRLSVICFYDGVGVLDEAFCNRIDAVITALKAE